MALVLHVDPAQSKMGGKAWQGRQRGHGMGAAGGKETLRMVGAGRAEGIGIVIVKGATEVRMSIDQEHRILRRLSERKHIAGVPRKVLKMGSRFARLARGECALFRNLATVSLDAFDLAILKILQRNNATPQRVIGDAVNLSAPAVQRRIKRMEETGVIAQNIAMVDPAKVGQPITIFVEVEVISESASLIDEAKRLFTAAPEVQQCYYVTGEADFILVILVASMADYEALTRRLFFENNNVKRFTTFVAMDRVKVGMSVPLP